MDLTQSGLMMNARRNLTLKYTVCVFQFHFLFCTKLD